MSTRCNISIWGDFDERPLANDLTWTGGRRHPQRIILTQASSTTRYY